jgi:hypothetical protein
MDDARAQVDIRRDDRRELVKPRGWARWIDALKTAVKDAASR